jgi:hypothetical protein
VIHVTALLHDPVILLVARFGLIGLFAAGCVQKLRHFDAFRDNVDHYELVPPFMLRPAAVLLVLWESLVVAALLIPATVSVGSVLAILLLGAYATAMGINLFRGRRGLDCGCTGPALRQPISEWLVLRNLLLAGAAWLAGGAAAERALGGWDYALVLAALCVTGLLYMASERLLANAPGLQRLIYAYD